MDYGIAKKGGQKKQVDYKMEPPQRIRKESKMVLYKPIFCSLF